MADAKLAAWGYHHIEAPRIFEDGNLPGGWSRTPLRGQHPHEVELGIRPDPPKANDGKPTLGAKG